MRIEYLEYLLEVARSKSISAAAKRLYLSQTSLSAIVNSLVKELNIKIFQRTHKGIVLTAEGEQALELAADIVEKNEQLQHLFSTSRTVRRIINLVVYPSVSNCLSVYLTRELGDEYPEIALHSLPAVGGMYMVNEALYKNIQLMLLGDLTPEEVMQQTQDYGLSVLKLG